MRKASVVLSAVLAMATPLAVGACGANAPSTASTSTGATAGAALNDVDVTFARA